MRHFTIVGEETRAYLQLLKAHKIPYRIGSPTYWSDDKRSLKEQGFIDYCSLGSLTGLKLQKWANAFIHRNTNIRQNLLVLHAFRRVTPYNLI